MKTLTKYLLLLEYFQMYHVFIRKKIKRLKPTPLPKHKSPTPVQVSPDDESLPDEIKGVVSEGNVESIVYLANGDGMQANYKVTYKKDEKDSRYTTYDFND